MCEFGKCMYEVDGLTHRQCKYQFALLAKFLMNHESFTRVQWARGQEEKYKEDLKINLA